MKKKHKILLDFPVSPSLGGKNLRGVPQDIARSFLAIQKISEADPTFLLYPSSFKEAISNKLLTVSTVESDYEILRQFFKDTLVKAGLLTFLKDKNPLYNASRELQNYLNYFKHLVRLKYGIRSISTEFFIDYIYRKIFCKFFDIVEFRNAVKKIYISDLSVSRVNLSSFYHYPTAYLDTSQFDFVIFHNPTQIKVSPNTTKIVRFHDAMHLRNPDFSFKGSGELLLNKLRACQNNSIFVCNSEPSKSDLIKIMPDIEKRAHVIPCALLNEMEKTQDYALLETILIKKLSATYPKDKTMHNKIKEKIAKLTQNKEQYIFHIGALEPKKNLLNLVAAWEVLNKKKKVNLVICGYLGYRGDEIYKDIEPYILDGSIIHIENLNTEELRIIYSHASLFVFPSLDEGFGIPPLEAMQCECPALISDIPSHRWVCDDAALYFNPYSVQDILEKIELILINKEGNSIRQQLVKKGLTQIKRYKLDNVAKEWDSLLKNNRSSLK